MLIALRTRKEGGKAHKSGMPCALRPLLCQRSMENQIRAPVASLHDRLAIVDDGALIEEATMRKRTLLSERQLSLAGFRGRLGYSARQGF
jgi:hypothetical protein